MWNFKGTLWNSTQNISPIHWKVRFLYNIEILRALRFKSSYAFLKRPPGQLTMINSHPTNDAYMGQWTHDCFEYLRLAYKSGEVCDDWMFWRCDLLSGTPVTISWIEFYLMMIFITIVVTITGICMAINYLLIYTLGFLYIISNFGSANAQLPGCFCPWTFSLNIGLNMFPLDSFMSCLHSLLGYSTGEFQALHLIVLVAFGAVD